MRDERKMTRVLNYEEDPLQRQLRRLVSVAAVSSSGAPLILLNDDEIVFIGLELINIGRQDIAGAAVY